MNINFSIILFYILIIKQNSVKNGVYNLLLENLYLSYNNRYISLLNYCNYPKTFFRIIKVSGNFNNSFYKIELIKNKLNISASENSELTFYNKNKNLYLWNFIKIDDNIFVIKNYNNCYLKNIKSKFFCENISQKEATQIKLNKIYFEPQKKHNNISIKILEEEPIDIVIKYIDLRDPNLIRNGIHQIEKDYDNEEIRYCIRSIIDYIPWVNKIFILMPNDKVSYFKDYNYIKDKIVYIKDKDLLGYDSSNSFAFQYRYWKMKKFGISDNIIVMDDDYFINKKLKKSDFFYVKKGKIFPFIVTSNFVSLEEEHVKNKCLFYKDKAKFSKEEQNSDIFNYSKYLTYLFILNLFNIPYGKTIYIPKFTHNAIPMNLNDIKEAYNIVLKSKYRYSTLDCPFRHYEYIQFQILVTSYTFLRYSRWVNDLSFKIISLNDSLIETYNFSLICINKIAGNYSYLDLYKAKIIMQSLFPKPSKYEKIDYSLFNIVVNTTLSMDKIIKKYEKKSRQEAEEKIKYIYFFNYFFLLLLLIKFNIFVKFFKYIKYF